MNKHSSWGKEVPGQQARDGNDPGESMRKGSSERYM